MRRSGRGRAAPLSFSLQPCRSELAAKNFDYQTVEYTATVKPGEKADLLYEVIQHQGRNAKQQNVTIERARPSRRPVDHL